MMGYVDQKPACSGHYFVEENGTAFINMACVYKEFRSCSYIQKLLSWVMIQIVKDPNVKNKDEMFAEARLEMIPYWTKKRPDTFRTVGEKYMGENGHEQFRCAWKLPKLTDQ